MNINYRFYLKSFFAFWCVLCLCFLTACTKPNVDKNEKVKLISVSSILASDQSDGKKAEEIALAAENLLAAASYQEANELAEQALNLDPKNLRAAFVKVSVAPLLVIKGIFTRVTPLAQKSGSLLKSLELKLAALELRSSSSQFHHFILDGVPDIDSEDKLQLVINDLIEALDQLRLFAKNNKSQTLTVKNNALIANQLLDNYVEACEVKIIESKLKYELVCPEDKSRNEVQFNRADFELIQHQVAGRIADLSILSAYDFTGSVVAHNEKTKDSSTMTHQQFYEKLLQNKQFGTLKNSSNLIKIKDLGLDAIPALVWGSQNQAEICPTGNLTSSQNRPGMFFVKGFCMDPTWVAPLVNIYTTIFNGNSFKAETYSQDNSGKVTGKFDVIYMKLFNEPLRDVRSLGLMQFDNCGQLADVEEPTMGGMFPNKDVNSYLNLSRLSCRK